MTPPRLSVGDRARFETSDYLVCHRHGVPAPLVATVTIAECYETPGHYAYRLRFDDGAEECGTLNEVTAIVQLAQPERAPFCDAVTGELTEVAR